MLESQKDVPQTREGIHVTRNWSVFLMFAVLTGAFTWANPRDNDDDGSYTRLARLSLVEGPVSFQNTSDAEWSAAGINLPLRPGDRIYTGPNGRAEIQFDDGSAFRLARNTDIEILSLDEDLIQLRMLLGLATLTVAGDADFEVNTPAAAFNAIREGIYRFDVVESGDTDAIVRKGELEAANNQFIRRLRTGELLHISPGTGGEPEISLYGGRDEWDEWTDRRAADIRVYGNVRHLPDNVYIGAAELDSYGRWVNVETYGTAWVPYDVDPYWSPYSTGRWCYRPFFGWTWISYEPWGWLPYHYGRWYRSSLYGWSWLPGPAFSFNFWSPALVTFYHGPGWISWCPLGPGDYYDVHHYHYNRGIYGHQLAELRRLHTRRPGDLFHRDSRGAFRTAHLDDFRNGAFDSKGSRWRIVDRPWREGSLVTDRLRVEPTSVSASAAPGRPAAGPRVTSTLPAVVRNVPKRDSGNTARLTRIVSPQVSSAPSRGLRSRTVSSAPASKQPVPGARIVTGSSRAGEQGSRRTAAPASAPERNAPSTLRQARPDEQKRQAAPDRSAPEVRPAPQRQSTPRSEVLQNDRSSAPASARAASPEVLSIRETDGRANGRDSGGVPTNNAPSAVRSFTWRGGEVQKAPEAVEAPGRNAGAARSESPGPARTFSVPRSSGEGRWSASERRAAGSSRPGNGGSSVRAPRSTGGAGHDAARSFSSRSAPSGNGGRASSARGSAERGTPSFQGRSSSGSSGSRGRR